MSKAIKLTYYQYKIDNRLWIMQREFNDEQLWTSNWLCNDGDIAELYIALNKSGFKLYCFSGVPSSNIYIDSIDFGTLWHKMQNSAKNKINKYEYTEQCVILADYLCGIFCELNKGGYNERKTNVKW